MVSKDPKVARPGYGVSRGLGDHDRRYAIVTAALAIRRQAQQTIELSILETDERQVVVLAEQVLQFLGEQRVIPRAEFRQFVVCDAMARRWASLR